LSRQKCERGKDKKCFMLPSLVRLNVNSRPSDTGAFPKPFIEPLYIAFGDPSKPQLVVPVRTIQSTPDTLELALDNRDGVIRERENLMITGPAYPNFISGKTYPQEKPGIYLHKQHAETSGYTEGEAKKIYKIFEFEEIVGASPNKWHVRITVTVDVSESAREIYSVVDNDTEGDEMFVNDVAFYFPGTVTRVDVQCMK